MIKSKKDMFKFIFSIIIAAIFLFNDMNSTYGTLFLGLLLFLGSIHHKGFRVNRWAAATVFFLIGSYMFSAVQTQSLENTILLAILAVGAGNLDFDNKFRQQVLKVVSLGCFLVGIYQFATQSIAAGPFVNIFNIEQQYPNAMAALALILLAKSDSKHFSIINILTILMSKSRFGLGVMVLVMLAKNIRKINKTLVVSVLMTICLSFGLIANFQKSSQTAHFSSIDQRVEHWLLTPSLFDHKTLLVGSGAGSFEYLFPSVQRIPLNNAPHSHNIVLNILLEYGVWVLLALVIIFHNLFRYQSRNTKVALLGFLIFNLFNLDYQFPLSVLVLLLIIEPIPVQTQKPIKPIFKFNWIIPSVLLAAIFIVPQNHPILNKYISHKDYWISQQNIDQYQAHSPLDIQAHHLRANAHEYSKQIFLNDPYTIANMELLLGQYPDIQFNQDWYDNYKGWYLSHVRVNHSFINEKGETQSLIQAMAKYDPQFSQQLQRNLESYQESSWQN